MRLAFALLAATALATPALAQPNPNVPVARPEDPNMRVVDYNPFARIRLVGSIGRTTILTFGPDEDVKRVIFGDDGTTWEGPDPKEVKEVPLGNNLPLFPRKPGYTSLQVITSVVGKPDRAYQFAVEARELPSLCQAKPVGCDDPDATYGLAFRYPADEAAKREAERQAERQAAQQRWRDAAPARAMARQQAHLVAMRGRLEVDFFAGGGFRNWRYEAQGNEAGRDFLAPDAVTDNGQETAFRYLGNRAVPAFFTVAPDGKEQSIQPNMRGDVAVLPQTAPEWRLRLGDAVLYVFNRAYDPAGANPGTGTTSPDVVRTVRQARAQ